MIKERALLLSQILIVAVVTMILPSSESGAWTAPRMRKSSVSSCLPSAPVAFTWTGGGGNSLWTTATNWYGGAVPATTDVVYFDGNCSSNCSPTFGSSMTIKGIVLRCDYSGNFNMGGNSFVIDSSGLSIAGGSFIQGGASMTINGPYSQSGGTFTQGAASMTINGTYTQSGGTFTGSSSGIVITKTNTLTTMFTMTGGTFTSTSGTLLIENAQTSTNADINLINLSGAYTFNHNNGTVTFGGYDTWSGDSQFTLEVGAGNNLSLYNVNLNGGGGYGSGHRIPAGETITVLNNFTLNGGTIAGGNSSNPDTWGEWLLKGTTNTFNSLDGNRNYGSYGTVTFSGTGNQNYTCVTGAEVGPYIKIDKASGTLTTSSSECWFSGLNLVQGSFTAPAGTLYVGWLQDGVNNSAITPTLPANIFNVASGTTFNHNNGTVTFEPYDMYNGDSFFTITVPNSFNLYNVTNNTASSYGQGLQITSGSIVVLNDFNWLGGTLYGDWELRGNALMAAPPHGTNNGTATFTFTGTGAQTVTLTSRMPSGLVTVNKSSGTLTFKSNMDLPSAGQNMTVTAGTVDMSEYNLSVNSTFTISSGATVNCNGGLLTYGSLSNSGTLNCTAPSHTFTSVGSIASAQNKTAGSTWNFNPSATLNAGNLGVLVIANDNLGWDDSDNNDVVSVTDSAGNIWKKRGAYTTSPSGPATGANVSIWTTNAATNLTGAGTITVTFSGSVTAKAATGWQYSFTGSSVFRVVGLTTRSDAADPGNLSLSGLTSNPYLWIRAVGQENSGTGWTASTNYTTFTHTTSTTSGGGAATNIGARGEFRIFTGTTDSTNPTGVSADNASLYLAIQ